MKNAIVGLSITLSQLVLLCLSSVGAHSQMLSASGQNSVPRPGDGHDYIQLLNETVNPGTGSVNVKLDIPQPMAKGLTLPFSISYNSGGVWQVSDSEIRPSIDSGAHGGWNYSYPRLTYKNVLLHYVASPSDYAYVPGTVPDADPGGTTCAWTTDYVFFDPSGQSHPLDIGAASVYPYGISECPGRTGLSALSDGGDNFAKAHLYVNGPVDGVYDPRPSQVTTLDGTTYTFVGGGIFASGGVPGAAGFQLEYPSIITDRNGNTVNFPFDSVGRRTPLLTVHGGPIGTESGVFTNELDTIAVSGIATPYQIQWVKLHPSGPSIYGTILPGNLPNCSENPSQLMGAFNGDRTPMGIGTITLPDKRLYTFGYDNVTGLLSTIVYPDGATVTYQWQMQHNFDQSVTSHVVQGNPYVEGNFWAVSPPGNASGGVNDISFPCGYAYDWPAITSRTVSFDGVHTALSQTFDYVTTLSTTQPDSRTTTVTTNDVVQGTTAKTIYHYRLSPTNDNDPYPFDSPQYGVSLGGGITTLVGPLAQPPVWTLPLEDKVTYYDNAANVLKTVTKTWGGDLNQWGAEPDQLRSETIAVGPNVASTFYDYEAPDSTSKISRLIRTTEIGYDGSPLVTTINYQDFPGPAQPYQYQFGRSIFDRPKSVTKSLTGITPFISETDYTNYDPNGNAGAITRKCWQGSGTCADESVGLTYDPSGLIHTRTDALGTTTYDRSNAYANAYVTTITYPPTSGISHVENFSYDFPSGHLTDAQDENGKWTNYLYKDSQGNPDPLGRLRETDYPDFGKTTIQYNDSGPSPTITVSRLDGPTSVSVMDGIGHVVQTRLSTTPSPTYIDTVYDGTGRVASVTNPYFPGFPNGATSYSYDALGRKVYQCQPDNGGSAIPCQPGNSYLSWQYASDTTIHGDVTTFADEARNATASTTDAFGRLMRVSEPGGLLTNYGYDVLGNLVSVNQLGISGETARTRSFNYDSLSRLRASYNPENTSTSLPAQLTCVRGGPWTTCFTYDANGNLQTKTDNRSIKTTYSYDPLNRLTGKTYSGVDPSVAMTAASCYQYDKAGTGLVQNAIGRLVYSWTQPGSCPAPTIPPSPIPSSALNWRSITAYDTMGRVKTEQQCPLAPCSSPKSLAYAYDLAGNLIGSTNGVPVPANGSPSLASPGILEANGFDAAGRLSSVSTNWNDATHPGTLFEADQSTQLLTGIPPYGPMGLVSAQLGVTSQSPQQTSMLMTRSYDKRARITNISVLGNSASSWSPVSLSISPSPVSFGVNPVSTSVCGDICGSGGMMIFLDGNEVGATYYSPSSPAVMRLLQPLSLGNHSYYVVYGGDATHATQTSATVTFIVIPNTLPATTLSAQISPAPVPLGESAQVDFTLTCNSSCSPSPSGDGYFLVDGNWGGGLTFDENGTASNQTQSNLSVGSHTLTAYYLGNGQYPNASYSGTFSVTQQNLPQLNMTATVLPSPIPEGEYGEVDVTSNCTANCGGGHLYVDGNYAGGFNLDADGGSDTDFLAPFSAAPWWAFMTAGQHQLSMVYYGNASFAPTTTNVTFTVIPDNLPIPNITASVTTYPISSGQRSFVTIGASCATSCGPSAPHLGSGYVLVDGNYAGMFTLDASGNLVDYFEPVSAAGSHSLRVQYFGNSSYQPANSGPVTFILTQ